MADRKFFTLWRLSSHANGPLAASGQKILASQLFDASSLALLLRAKKLIILIIIKIEIDSISEFDFDKEKISEF